MNMLQIKRVVTWGGGGDGVREPASDTLTTEGSLKPIFVTCTFCKVGAILPA